MKFSTKTEDEKYRAPSQYEPEVLARNGHPDWIDLVDDVLADVEIASR